jgi:hypothetical protein
MHSPKICAELRCIEGTDAVARVRQITVGLYRILYLGGAEAAPTTVQKGTEFSKKA